MRRFALVLVLLMAAADIRAAEPAKLEVKSKSSFKMDNGSRSPFWPIGWKPAPKVAAPTEQGGPEIPESAFVVTSITLDNGTRFAIINHKTMQEGQVFGLQMGNQTYQLTVKVIEDGRVILDRRGQQIIVPLHRH